MDLSTFLFWIIAALTGLSAVAVVVTQNIVRSALWLLFTLGGTAGVFFHIGADFVGATQLIVYVGGILVLVVFGVMLTAQGPFLTMRTNPAEWAIAMVVGVVLFGVLAVSTSRAWPESQDRARAARWKNATASQNSVVLGEAFLGIKETAPPADLTGLPAGSEPKGRTKMAYLLPFEIVSVHLLVVLIGAAYLARAKRRRGAVS